MVRKLVFTVLLTGINLLSLNASAADKTDKTVDKEEFLKSCPRVDEVFEFIKTKPGKGEYLYAKDKTDWLVYESPDYKNKRIDFDKFGYFDGYGDTDPVRISKSNSINGRCAYGVLYQKSQTWDPEGIMAHPGEQYFTFTPVTKMRELIFNLTQMGIPKDVRQLIAAAYAKQILKSDWNPGDCLKEMRALMALHNIPEVKVQELKICPSSKP
jgi:hypothetical protein